MSKESSTYEKSNIRQQTKEIFLEVARCARKGEWDVILAVFDLEFDSNIDAAAILASTWAMPEITVARERFRQKVKPLFKDNSKWWENFKEAGKVWDGT